MKDYVLVNTTDRPLPQAHDDPLPEGRASQPVVPGGRGPVDGRRDALDGRAGRPARPLHRPDGLGRRLGRAGPPAPEPAPEHRRGDARRREDRPGPDGPDRAGRRPGSTWSTTSTGSTAAGDSPGSASATAGGTSTSPLATGASPGSITPGRLRRDRRRPRGRRGRARSTSSPRPTTPRRATSTGCPLDGSAAPRRLTPDGSAGHARLPGLARRPVGDPHPIRASADPPVIDLVSLPDHEVGADPGRQRRGRGRSSTP